MQFQLDSNTIIHDYQGLYDVTFGRPGLSAVNASYYDEDYVSIHNKIVYVPSGTEFIAQLRAVHLTYCADHAGDHLSESTKKEKISKNSIYAKDFALAACQAGLTTVISIPDNSGELRTIYPAVMSRPEYGLSRFIVTAVNMSWSAAQPRQLESIARLPLVQVGDAYCDIACYKMSIKKYIGRLINHKYGGHPELLAHDLAIQDPIQKIEALREDEIAHQELLACSDINIDKAIIARFYESALEFVHGRSDAHEVMALLAKEFLDNARGNALTQEIFGCSVSELYADPMRHTTSHRARFSDIPDVVSATHLVESEQTDLNRQIQQELKARLNADRAIYAEQEDQSARQSEEKDDEPPVPSAS